MRLLGYIALDQEGNPYRSPRSGYGFHTQSQKGYHPPRIYQDKKRAEKMSPVGASATVYTDIINEENK